MRVRVQELEFELELALPLLHLEAPQGQGSRLAHHLDSHVLGQVHSLQSAS